MCWQPFLLVHPHSISCVYRLNIYRIADSVLEIRNSANTHKWPPFAYSFGTDHLKRAVDDRFHVNPLPIFKITLNFMEFSCFYTAFSELGNKVGIKRGEFLPYHSAHSSGSPSLCLHRYTSVHTLLESMNKHSPLPTHFAFSERKK